MMLAIYSLLAVVVGAFFGGMGRWALATKPGGVIGTFIANTIACIVLGWVASQTVEKNADLIIHIAAGTGFAGALSTWSTLAKELGEYIRVKHYRMFWGYLVLTLGGGIGGVLLGSYVGAVT